MGSVPEDQRRLLLRMMVSNLMFSAACCFGKVAKLCSRRPVALCGTMFLAACCFGVGQQPTHARVINAGKLVGYAHGASVYWRTKFACWQDVKGRTTFACGVLLLLASRLRDVLLSANDASHEIHSSQVDRDSGNLVNPFMRVTN